MKIVTLAAAAERLGWDYTYETRVLGVGAIDAGVLDGDLLVVGSGDPSIVDRDGIGRALFDELGRSAQGARHPRDRRPHHRRRQRVRRRGARVRLVVGRSRRRLRGRRRRAAVQREHGSADDRAGRVGRRAGDASRSRRTAAASSIRNLLTTAAAGHASRPSRRAVCPAARASSCADRCRSAARPTVRTASVDNPDAVLRHGAARRAHRARHRGSRAARSTSTTSATRRRGQRGRARHLSSPPLSTLALRLMKISQNLYAETLLKTMGAAAGTPTAEAGRARDAIDPRADGACRRRS